MEVHEMEIQIAILRTELHCTKEALAKQEIEYARRLREQEDRAISLEKEMVSLVQFKWISVGAGLTGGGVSALLMRLFQ